MNEIRDVVVKKLVTHNDERGYFRELIRVTDDFFREGFGQWSMSLMYPGIVKAWHIHRIQTDWWFVPSGTLKVALHDARPDSPTSGMTQVLHMGEHCPPSILKIPPGVAHGCKCISGPATLFYVTSHVYNPDDEGRRPHDDPSIGFDWLALPPIT
ncbi:MAG: dTDP-4-dehydrorhamnose 3,5-epimerase family protein [Candidatus Hydrogenedentota bacterium]